MGSSRAVHLTASDGAAVATGGTVTCTIKPAVTPKPVHTRVRVIPRATCRPRERRERRHVAKSTSSADPGSDSDPELPVAEPWRWADPATWQAFVKDILDRRFENELAHERAQGWSR